MSQVSRTNQLKSICTALKVLERAVLRIAKEELIESDYKDMSELFSFGKPRRMVPVRQCDQCQKSYQGRGRRFCSHGCSEAFANGRKVKPPIKRVCPQCSNTFESRGKRKYCFLCKEDLKTTRPPKPCQVCGEVFLPAQRAQKFCTKMCKQKWFNTHKATTAGRKQLIKTLGKCEHCAEADTRSLHAHHVNGQERNELMLLCANCHYKYHHIMGRSVFAETRTRADVLQVLRTGDAVVKVQETFQTPHA